MSADSVNSQIVIDLQSQQLRLLSSGETVEIFSVSTAVNGAGERDASGCTPRGRHYIRAAIGKNCPERTVFVGRRPTGEVYSPALADQHPGRDWILSRILWLCGLEPGINRGPGHDTFHRYIYIHGTPDSEPMGIPLSHGCIRMRNDDVIHLFEKVSVGTPVLIQ